MDRWRNYLSPGEMPWLRGHEIQRQIIFPAAGFAVMALEAARNLAPLEMTRLMEVQSLGIRKTLSFTDENACVETTFTLSGIERAAGTRDDSSPAYATALFNCYACMNNDVGEFFSVASGKVKLTLGEPLVDALPARTNLVEHFVDTDVEFFYESLAALDYGYTGMFQGITDLQRTNSGSKGSLTIPQEEASDPQSWIIHPATLDVGFQAVFAAVGAPGDGRLWTLHVSTLIDIHDEEGLQTIVQV